MPQDLEDNSVAPDTRTNEELDAIGDSPATNQERPMSAPTPEEKAAKAGPGETFEIVHNGKTIKGTREQILKWAQMGYDRPQVAQRFNQEKAKWEQEKAAKEQQWATYQKVDEYAKQNADWWAHVQQAWTNRATPGAQAQAVPGSQAPVDAYFPKLQALEQKISQFEPVVQKVSEFYLEQQRRIEGDTLDREIKSIREEHKDLDWDSLDENGKALETRILEHASEKKIQEFGIAFRDLLHKDLINKARGQGQLAVAKGIQNRTKLGVLGDTPTPSMWNQRAPKNIRSTTYEDLQADINEEIRAGKFK